MKRIFLFFDQIATYKTNLISLIKRQKQKYYTKIIYNYKLTTNLLQPTLDNMIHLK